MPARLLSIKDAYLWTPRSPLAPQLSRDGEAFVVASNGSEGCYGGWELTFPAPPTEWVTVTLTAELKELRWGLDHVQAAVVWDAPHAHGLAWEPIPPVQQDGNTVTFHMRCQSPPQTRGFALRLLLGWAPAGEVRWSQVKVEAARPPKPRRWRLGAMGGDPGSGKRTMKKNATAYLGWARDAAERGVDLLCLPEVMLSTGLHSSPEDLVKQAIAIPGKALEPFQELAREAKMALCFSAWEKSRELVHNCAVLIGKDGALAGKYRKVHLASPLETWWGVTPGHDFPVYEVDGARIAMNICMDSSATESARVPARQGAEIICLPIMGDHRCDCMWTGLDYKLDLERWVAIQRVRAMDNQVWMVISRNTGPGTGIFAPTGDVLAMVGESDGPLAYADVDLSRPPRMYTWALNRGVLWWERREPAYWPLVQTQVPPFGGEAG